MTTKDETGAAPSRTEQAKQLLAQYGSAYLVTSISFAVVSFAACYAAVSAGGLSTRGRPTDVIWPFDYAWLHARGDRLRGLSGAIRLLHA
jgi:hypothetical protein